MMMSVDDRCFTFWLFSLTTLSSSLYIVSIYFMLVEVEVEGSGPSPEVDIAKDPAKALSLSLDLIRMLSAITSTRVLQH